MIWAWIWDHIEYVLGSVGGLFAGLAAMLKLLWKDRLTVIGRIAAVERGLGSTTSAVNNLEKKIELVEKVAMEERSELKRQLEKHSSEMREDIRAVHARTDDLHNLLSELPMKIISAQRDSK